MSKLQYMKTKLQELFARRNMLETQFYEGTFILDAWEDLAVEFEEHGLPHAARALRRKAKDFSELWERQ